MRESPLFVTRPLLPDYDDFCAVMKGVWDRGILSNGGPVHQDFEQALANFFQVERVSLFNNATTALIAALTALDLEGEVITTPFTFAATAQALLWCGLEPVFVDVDPCTGNLDPSAVAAAITDRTAAILPVHCYGWPCDVPKFDDLARVHGVKVIYDAAPALGTVASSFSLPASGDCSVYSFHATKVLNSFEGGCVIASSDALQERLVSLRNFGFDQGGELVTQGLNGKMSEASAAMGLLSLGQVEQAIIQRRHRVVRYRKNLADCAGVEFFDGVDCDWNAAYFPVKIVAGAQRRDALCCAFAERNIFPRRYFYPLLCEANHFRAARCVGDLPVARALARQVLALPLYPDLPLCDVDVVCDLLRSWMKHND